MRFFADGPDIPDRLLEERDNGNVVFFCGAGISQPVGLPSFRELTVATIEALHDTALPPPALFALLKLNFLDLFKSISSWRWDSGPGHRLNQFAIIACYWHKKDKRYLNYDEVRLALQQMNDEGRANAVATLNSIVKTHSAWKTFGKPFVKKAWPKEIRFRSPMVSSQFATLAAESQDQFPDVVKTILSTLGPAEHAEMFIYRIKTDRSERSKIVQKYPQSCLALLDRLVPGELRVQPYDLGWAVNAIAEASPALRQDSRWRRLDKLAGR